MHLSSSSAAGVQFLTSVMEGSGLKRSAREAGIGKETGYRWLREADVAHRRGGKSIAETAAVMGFAPAKSIAWEAEVAAGPGSSFPPGHTVAVMVCLGVAVLVAHPRAGRWVWFISAVGGGLMGASLLLSASDYS